MSGPKTFSPVVPSCRGIDPFEMLKWKKRKRGPEKKRGLPSNAKMRGGEWIGRIKTVCWFSSPDFTLRNKSWSVMEGCMAVVSTGTAMKTILLWSRDVSSHTYSVPCTNQQISEDHNTRSCY